MKKLTLIPTILLSFVLLATMGCGGGGDAPGEEPPPVVDTTATEPEVEDTTPAEPEVRQISESEFQTVYFDFDKSNIKTEFRAALENNAALMKESMDLIVQIEGHCDERGTEEYNIALSERRAVAAKNYMINLGIADSRISIQPYGKMRPAMMGHNEVAWSKNRRAEFIITSQ